MPGGRTARIQRTAGAIIDCVTRAREGEGTRREGGTEGGGEKAKMMVLKRKGKKQNEKEGGREGQGHPNT